MLALLIALSAPQPDADTLGRYVVRDHQGRQVCAMDLRWEPSVGGEIAVAPNCTIPPLRDAARWEEDGAGGFVFRDAIRGRVAHVVEDEAGLDLRLTNGRAYPMAKLDRRPPLSADARTRGSWTLLDRRDPDRGPCHVVFAPAHKLQIGRSCPARVTDFRNATWVASEANVTIRAGRASILFEWSDAASLSERRGSLELVHD